MTTNGAPQQPQTGLVAIIGLGCVLPDANNVEEFWANLRAGKSAVREVPRERWDPALYYSPDHLAPDKTYSKIGAFVTGFKLDPRAFRIPPSVVKSLDESQLWGLAAAAQALRDSGYDTKPFDRTRTAVILGNAMGGEVRMMTSARIMFPEFQKALEEAPGFMALGPQERAAMMQQAEKGFKRALPEITEDTMPGELSNVIAGRIANLLNFTGKNFTTDAACASSLAAIDAAVRALMHREADMVLTGGVDRSMDVGSYVKFCKIGALSANGSFPYDHRADGFVMGEGAGMLLLKRLEDAQRDGDKIYAVVRGVGSSSDGKGKGITAPNIEGQISCVQRALRDAQVNPGEVDLVEGHGTSTKVGDVVEVQALTQIFGPHVAAKQSIPLGSVKSNLGHLKSAAGAAGLLKVALALREKTLPPSINFERPNPNLQLEETPFYVNATAKPWPEPANGRPRRAAISSFGFGGTNFHVILEEYAPGKNTPKVSAAAVGEASARPTGPVASVLLHQSPKGRAPEALVPAGRMEVLVVGASTAPELDAELRRLQDRLKSVNQRAFAAFAHAQALAGMRAHIRVALVAETPTEAMDKLGKAREAVLDVKKRTLLANQGIHFGEGRAAGKIAFLFPGQGSQYADMGRDLATRFQAVKRTLDDADRVMEPLVGKPLTSFLFSDEAHGHTKEKVEEQLKRTEITQPAVLAADASLFRLLGDYGIRPDLVAGHSLGEYGALIAAGVLTFDDALLAVSARGREMANVHVPDLGKMASVSADTATVEAKLKSIDGYVIPANKNCKVQTVIAGASPAVEAAVQMFQKEGIAAQFIPVSAAFHSKIVAPATEPMKKVLGALDIREPKIPVLSNVHADYYPRGPGSKEAIVDLLGRQVAAPVEWQKQIERMYAEGARLFVEVGPKTVLTTFVKNVLEGQPHAAIGTNHPKKGGFATFFDAVAFLAAHGHPVKFPKPEDAIVHAAAFRDAVDAVGGAAATPVVSAPIPATPQKVFTTTEKVPTPAVASVTGLAFPNLEAHAESFIRQKQEELRRVLEAEMKTLSVARAPSNVATPAADEELLALKKRVAALGLNLDPILITGVSAGTPGSAKKLFDDTNFERIFAGENAIDALTDVEQRGQVAHNVVRLVKSDSGDHRFESIRDVAEVIKLAAKKGEFDLAKDYGINVDLVEALDITSKMAIAAGIEALKDARIPLVRGYVKTTTGKFLPGEWALPEPLQAETGIVFASAFPGYANLVDDMSRRLASKYGHAPFAELDKFYGDLVNAVSDPSVRSQLEAWYEDRRAELGEAGATKLYEFNRRFLVRVLSLGHAQLAQLIRAKGPNTQINAACASTTQGIAVAEDWIRTGRCKRVLVVGADDITNPEMLDTWASGFLAAGAATTKADVKEAALPFDKRRHGMIIGAGAVGIVVEAESVVKDRGMEGIAEVVATAVANSAYHITRLDTEHVATLMDQMVGDAERRTGVPRGTMAEKLVFMSHETYTPARGGSAAAEIAALSKAFGADVHKVVVANTKGFTGHPMGAGIEDAIAVRTLQAGRVPPIANLKEPDPTLGNIRLSKGGSYDLEWGLRLAAGFGSQIAMYVMRLRSRDTLRIVDANAYKTWLARAAGTKTPELEVVNRTLRVKASLPALAEAPTAPRPAVAPVPPAPAPARPAPAPMPAVAAPKAGVTQAQALARVVGLVADKTGYPQEMLEPDLDLEADLGIDTVKQAELFGILRETYGIERDDSIQLKDFNTLNKIAQFFVARSGGATNVAAAAPAPKPALVPNPPAASPAAVAMAPKPVAGDRAQVLARLVDIVADKTGYPKEMLEPDLDLEADLGIDTVKQAEVFGVVRTSFNVERDDSVQLKDVNTLAKIADYFATRMGGQVAAAAPAPAVAPPSLKPVPAVAATSRAAAPSLDRAAVLHAVRSTVADKTGYPLDLLDPDLDLEADLGIDTVKQAELFGILRETYTIERDDSIQLKDYNTLNKLADFIIAKSGKPAPAAAPQLVPSPPAQETAKQATPEPVAPMVPSAPAVTSATHGSATDHAAVLEKVRSVVAEKTGYPLDLLDPDLDLEADLGIDTVKQAELFGIVRETYGVQRDDTVQLKDFNTLNKLATYMVQRAGAATATATTTVVETLVEPAPVQERTTHRYVVRYAPAPPGPSDANALDGRTLAVWATGPLRADLVYALKRAGAHGIALDALPTRLEEAVQWVQEQRARSTALNGIVFIPAPNPTGSDYAAEDVRVTKALFYLVKALASTAKPGEFDTLGIVTHMGGDFAAEPSGPIDPLEGALVGLAKAVAREVPTATVKAVDVRRGTAPTDVARILIEELGRKDGLVEVGTAKGRGTLRLMEQETAEEEPGVDLTANDVVLVSGGGVGITSDIVQRMARLAPATFVLLGRTPLHADAARFATFNEQTWNGKRVEVQAELKARGDRVTPVAVEKAMAPLRKSAEIHATLEAVRRAGGKAEYHAVDVNDAKAVEHLIKGLRATVGTITGIVHAAGIEESKLLADKTPESFDRVFDVKVVGARNLLAPTVGGALRFFLAFSSIAGRFGNAGQLDYSAANDALAKLCAALRVERGANFPATAIDWSAWGEKGMATRGSVMTVLKEAGVTAIRLQEGVERFAEELQHGCRDAEVLVAGELGRLAAPGSFISREDAVAFPPPVAAPGPAPVHENPSGQTVLVVEEAPTQAPHGNLILSNVSSDGRTATATFVLDPAKDPYLRDHRVDGVPYLPGVFGQEAFAEVAARLAPGKRYAGANDVEFRLPVKVLRDQPLEVTVVASVAYDSDEQTQIGCRLQSVFVNAKGERLGAPRIHFTGTVLFERDPAPQATAPEPTGDLEPRIIEKSEIYEHYFHGPSFRVLNNVGFQTDGKTTIGVWADPRAPLFGDRKASFLTSPMLRELAYQTAGAHELFKNRYLALPKGEAKLTYHRDPGPTAAVRAVAEFKGLVDNVAHFDVTCATTDGDVVFTLTDFQLIRLRPLEATNGEAPVPAPSAPTVYRARWGHDVPLPLPGVVGVLVDLREIAQSGVTANEALTAGERADQERYRNDKRASEFFAGRLAAKEAIATLVGRPVREARGVEIRRLETGEPQPRGSGTDGVLVSITHRGDTALAAAARRDPRLHTIGIDLEPIEVKARAFETEAFTDGERRLIDRLETAGSARAELIVRFWAVKEAVLKALGKGFALDVRDVQVQAIDADERVDVLLAPPAQKTLSDLGAAHVRVQTWVRDGLAYALAWTQT